MATDWDINGAVYEKTLNVSTNSPALYAMQFKPDGTKMMVASDTATTVMAQSYTLSTAWDIGTASYDSGSDFSLEANNNVFPQHIRFKPDGTHMYVIGMNTGFNYTRVWDYTLSTAWDLTTASYTTVSGNLLDQFADSQWLGFNSDGTKLHIHYTTSPDPASYDREIKQFSMSTAWDLSTLSSDGVIDVAEGTQGDGSFAYHTLTPDDDRVYAFTFDTSSPYDTLEGWNLTTASDFRTSSPSGEVLDLSARSPSSPVDSWPKPDGTKLYIADGGKDEVWQYDVPVYSVKTDNVQSIQGISTIQL